MNLSIVIICLTSLSLLISFPTDAFSNKHSLSLKPVQVIVDNKNGFDGLDNPRAITIDSQNQKAFVVSDDDNSLAIFDIIDGQLSPNQLFKNNVNGTKGLEGASQVVLAQGGALAATVGFYDGALNIYQKDKSNRYQLIQGFSDELSPKRVFQDKTPLTSLDKLGLLGPWDMTYLESQKTLYIASYMSDAITSYQLTNNNQFQAKQIFTANGALNRPVTLAFDKDKSLVYVLGAQQPKLSVLKVSDSGQLTLISSITLNVEKFGFCLGPQKIIQSNNQLYIGCAQSNAILVLNTKADNQIETQQIIKATDNPKLALKGVAAMAVSSNKKWLFAVGEHDSGISIFAIDSDGNLNHHLTLAENETNKLNTITDIELSSDQQYLFLNSAQSDSISVFKIDW